VVWWGFIEVWWIEVEMVLDACIDQMENMKGRWDGFQTWACWNGSRRVVRILGMVWGLCRNINITKVWVFEGLPEIYFGPDLRNDRWKWLGSHSRWHAQWIRWGWLDEAHNFVNLEEFIWW
jgi:hypothetical protein